jgi:hypothetical protein
MVLQSEKLGNDVCAPLPCSWKFHGLESPFLVYEHDEEDQQRLLSYFQDDPSAGSLEAWE